MSDNIQQTSSIQRGGIGNPFDVITRASVRRPLLTLLVALLILCGGIALMVNHISADVSRSSFYPDNEVTNLLIEVEAEYNEMELDLLHALVPLGDGGFESSANWERLANIESTMINHQATAANQLGLFGGRPVVGPAGLGILFSTSADPEVTAVWTTELKLKFSSIESALDSGNQTQITAALTAAVESTEAVDEPPEVNAADLLDWDFTEINWTSRMFEGQNSLMLLEEFESTLAQANLAIHDHDNLSVQNTQLWTNNISFALHLKLDVLEQIQAMDFARDLRSLIPHTDSTGAPIPESQQLSKADVGIVTLAITTEGFSEAEVVELTTGLETAIQLELTASEIDGEKPVVFGFNRFSKASTETASSESPMLTSLAILLLGMVLWTRFRSLRETLFVLVPTALSIPITFGIVSWLGAVFNPAMFSIPVLILAIGVDYGLHVVARYREIAAREATSAGLNPSEHSLANLTLDIRRRAVVSGTVLTSAALVVAITTDVVGFMSFNISNLRFLRDFGTTIAVGLFLVYLSSISVVPALLVLCPPKSKTIISRKLFAIESVTEVEESGFPQFIGELTSERKRFVWIVVALFSLPMLYGITKLEAGFDFRDQLIEDDAGVVTAFIALNDRFSISPSPLWLVIDLKDDSDLFSTEGISAHNQAFAMLESEEMVSGDVNSLWSELERYTSRPQNSTFSSSGLQRAMDGDEFQLQQLENWLLTPEGRNLSSPYLSDDHTQMVIRFQAATLDSEQSLALASSLDAASENLEVGFEYRVTGDDLVIALVTEGITDDSVRSTFVVALVILLMLVSINSFQYRDPLRGLIMWAPLCIVVCWVYGLLGLLGYPLNVQVVTIGALTLGLGVDYSVHFSTRMVEESEEDPIAGPAVWTSRTVATTGRAMCAASLTTAGGFIILLTSSLYPLKLMGISFAIAITMALVSSLVLLPTLLSSRLVKNLNHSEE